MIFLSHNYKDKPIVEPIALELESIYGKKEVFYDSWSIQPGDGIVEKMNDGLFASSFFFFFISANSLASPMVKLEWQNALYMAMKGKIRFIPVRIDGSMVPPILYQSLFIDFFSNGFSFGLKQITDIVSGNNTFIPTYQTFKNVAAVEKVESDSSIVVCFFAKYVLDPVPRFCIITDNDLSSISIENLSDASYYGSMKDGEMCNDGKQHNALYVAAPRPIVPGFPFQIRIKSSESKKLTLNGISREKQYGEMEALPIVSEQDYYSFIKR